ncbi:MAG: hypothetical protein ACRC5T_06870 [Cetobacterium sp.]
MNYLLIGNEAIRYRKENHMNIVYVSSKETMYQIIENYSESKEHLSLDISDMDKATRLLLLKFSEERKNLTCISKKDIQDPILLSRFNIKKESLISVGELSNMPILDFCKIYNEINSSEDVTTDLKQLVLENCPKFIMLPKNKVMELLIGD